MRAGRRTFLSRKEVAELFQVSPSTVTRWANTRKLPSVPTLGGQRRYPRQEVERLLRQLFTTLKGSPPP
jgi:excisionase family DNA binding protein